MRFWDSSAVCPLLVRDAFTARSESLYEGDTSLSVWCLTPVEVWSAISRRRRDHGLGSPEMRAARDILRRLSERWVEISDIAAVVQRARRILEVHPLRAGDSLQLAAALYAVADRPEEVEFVTFDSRLAECAEREGFRVVGATSDGSE